MSSDEVIIGSVGALERSATRLRRSGGLFGGQYLRSYLRLATPSLVYRIGKGGLGVT